MLSAALSSGLDSVTLDMKGVRLSLPHLFKSAFKNLDLPKTFRLEAKFEHGRYETSVRSSATSTNLEFATEALYDADGQVFGRSGHGIRIHRARGEFPDFSKGSVPTTKSVWSVVGPLIPISDEFRKELDEFSKFAIYAPQTAVMRGLALDQRVLEPLGLTGSGLAHALATIPRKSPQDFMKMMKVIWEPGWADQVRTDAFDVSIVPGQTVSSCNLTVTTPRLPTGRRRPLESPSQLR